MDDYHYNSIDDLRGRALAHTQWDGSKFDFKYGQLVTKIDADLCTGCNICGGHICYALTREEGKTKVDETLCAGCGLCVVTCPSGAMTLVERAKPKELDLARGIPKLEA
jgi:TPP-dependent indolepyruvate ferredoxin oxidoreductase alpha subunit